MWQLYFILTDLVWFAWPPKIEHLIFKFFWKFAVFSYLNHLKNQIKYVHFCKPILILYLWWLLVYPFKKSLFLKICINSVNSCWSQPNSKLATKKNHHRKPLSRIYNASLQFIQNPHEGTLTMALHYIWAKLISEGPFFYLYISQISQWSL